MINNFELTNFGAVQQLNCQDLGEINLINFLAD